MWDLGSDFLSYNVNLTVVNFYGRSIPSMSWENIVWYFGIGSLGTSLIVVDADPSGMMSLPDLITVWLLSL